MSKFSTELKKYIDRRGISIAALARQLEIDRTTLHKIISGERRPNSAEQISNLSRLLMLSTDETAELHTLYKITVMGENVYMRRLRVKRMIERLSALSNMDISPEPFRFSGSEPAPSSVKAYYSQGELLGALTPVLYHSSVSGSDVQVICQPDKLLRSVIGCCSLGSGRTEHIICLDNSPDSEYNLECFPVICDLAFGNENYRPMCYYGSIREHINSMTLLPVLILTDDFVLCADSSFSAGVIYSDKAAVSFYRSVFEKLKADCFSFIMVDSSFADMLSRYTDYPTYTLTFGRQPSITVTLEKSMLEGLPPAEYGQLKAALEKCEMLKKKFFDVGYINIFSAEGLRNLLETGVSAELELPPGSCLSLDTRRRILRRMIELTENGSYDYRIVRSEYASGGLRVNLLEGKNVKLVLRRAGGSLHFVDVTEQSIVSAFNDYIGYLISEGMVYSRERTLEIMRACLSLL